MHRIEMTDIDQRIAKVCDPATATRYVVIYHNHNTGERWLVARLLPSEVERFRDSLKGQDCEIVISNREHGEWDSISWLRQYRKDAPIEDIIARLTKLRS